jgi:hypothetical protein
LTSGKKALLQMILDGTDSNSAAIILGYSSKIVSLYAREILVQWSSRLQGGGPLFSQINLESRAWFNENLESRNFFGPGVIALLVMLITLLLTSMAVVREKEIGTMEQIMVTPITPREFRANSSFYLDQFHGCDFNFPGGNLCLVPTMEPVPFLATGFYIVSLWGWPAHFYDQPDPTAGHDRPFSLFFRLCSFPVHFPIANMPEPVNG